MFALEKRRIKKELENFWEKTANSYYEEYPEEKEASLN